jgi:hypothetical protein
LQFTRKSVFGRWAAPAKRLTAERRADREGAGGATFRRSDLAIHGLAEANLGCITDEGRPIRL